MTKKKDYEEYYESGTTPWELNRPDSHLIRIVENKIIKPCNALEIGCGTGSNAIWLSTQGFKVSAMDFSSLAIEKAKEKAQAQAGNIRFHVTDFLLEEKVQPDFEFVFDRGCFHSIDNKKDRKTFAENVARHLKPEGFWFSMIGNADELPRDDGPPVRSALDIVTACEPFFEILSLVSDRFDSKRQNPSQCWLCLMKKRGEDKEENEIKYNCRS